MNARVSAEAYNVLAQYLIGPANDPTGRTRIILDIPTGYALDELDRMSTAERRNAIVLTPSDHPAYRDVLGSYYIRFVATISSRADITFMRAFMNEIDRIPSYMPATDLTYSQARVLRYLLRGFTTTEVAERLGNSPKTIASHASTLIRKFGVQTRAELVGQLLTGARADPKAEAVPA